MQDDETQKEVESKKMQVDAAERDATLKLTTASILESLAEIRSLLQDSTCSSAVSRRESDTLSTQENHECVVTLAGDLNSRIPGREVTFIYFPVTILR